MSRVWVENPHALRHLHLTPYQQWNSHYMTELAPQHP